MVDTPPVATPSPTVLAAMLTTTEAQPVLLPATVQVVPDRLLELLRQIQISGSITDLTNDGTLTLKTTVGDLKLFIAQLAGGESNQLAFQLMGSAQTQRPLNLILQPGQPPTQAFLVMPTAVSQTQPVQKESATSLAAPMPKQATDFAVGSVLSVVVLPDAPDSSLPFLAPTLGKGIDKKAADTATETPMEEKTNSTVGAKAPAPDALTVSRDPKEKSLKESVGKFFQTSELSTQAEASIAGKGAIPLRAGTLLHLKINTIIHPASGSTTPTPLPSSSERMTATVVGNGPGGQLILKAGENTLFVKQSGHLPIGTQILMTHTTPPSPEDIVLRALDQPESAITLQQIAQALSQVDPTMARQILNTHVPSPQGNMAGALLFFLNAMGQDNFGGWMGDLLQAKMEKIKKQDLLVRLTDELKKGKSVVEDTMVGEWKACTIPFFDQNQPKIILFYYRDNRQSPSEQKEESTSDNEAKPQRAATRFVVSFTLSKLGAIQLDGLVSKKKLDMVIRSENELSCALRVEIRDLYMKNLQAIDYVGGLKFQNGRQDWLHFKNHVPVASSGVLT